MILVTGPRRFRFTEFRCHFATPINVRCKMLCMAVGTGKGAVPIFCQPKKIKSLKTTTYKSTKAIRLKYAHSSVDIGNHRYTNVQNCILLKYKCNEKNSTASKIMCGA